MSRPYFSVKHVESLALLPENLTPGRIYFVDDEQYIVIDHGNGLPPVIYGGKPGPQGASGEPQPHLQEQIDTLAQTELQMQAIMWDEIKHFKKTIAQLSEHFTETFDLLRGLTDKNAQSIMTLADTIHTDFTKYDSAIAILGKAVANLYPDGTYHGPGSEDDTEADTSPELMAENINIGDDLNSGGTKYTVLERTLNSDGSLSLSLEGHGAFSDKSDPLDDETLNSPVGNWVIQQSILADGSTVFDLQAQSPLLDNLSVGDSVSAGEESFTVSDITREEDGTISLTLSN